jgi:hypothetical protein
MKSINIEKNNRVGSKSTLLIWIFCLVIFSAGCTSKEKDNADGADATATDIIETKEDNGTVNEYVTFVRNDKNKMALDHAYANEALLKLTSATEAMAGEVGFDIKADLDKAKECANKITDNPFETSHADEIRKAAEILAGTLQNIQVAKYPGLSSQAEEVKSAAMAIDPQTLTLDQKDAVKTFFGKGADLLEKMN